jgi:hypothetical protein
MTTKHVAKYDKQEHKKLVNRHNNRTAHIDNNKTKIQNRVLKVIK